MSCGEWEGKSVLVTGACGTVGAELLRLLRAESVDRIVGIDNNESALFFAQQDNADDPRVELGLGDIRDRHAITSRMVGIDIVLHTAALKHVHLCEESPRDAIQTNIQGIQNLIDAAFSNNVERVLFTSSDKAVNPTTVMGTSKLMGERLMTAAQSARRTGGPRFTSTRFGNVLGSRGSVIPLFRRQISAGGPVTLTDPAMTRFIMSLTEATRLVMDSVFMARGGEVFVTKMPALRIPDLALAMVQALAPQFGHDPDRIEIRVVGPRPGEKIFEELVNEEEVRRTLELEKYFVVLPPGQSGDEHQYSGLLREEIELPYTSRNQKAMSVGEVAAYLESNHLLGPEPAEARTPRRVAATARKSV